MYIKLATEAIARSMEKYHFLLPVGGTMTVTEYWHVNVFRLGLKEICEVLGRFEYIEGLYSNFLSDGATPA